MKDTQKTRGLRRSPATNNLRRLLFPNGKVNKKMIEKKKKQEEEWVKIEEEWEEGEWEEKWEKVERPHISNIPAPESLFQQTP